MNVALRTPRMTRDEFFPWAEQQDVRYEFDGLQPVAMTGGTLGHSLICQNVWAALRARLRGTRCTLAGPDAGLATVGQAVRYPDALVTCSPVSNDARMVPGVVVVIEVLSPTSGRTDRIVKVREYAAVPSILRYVILELGTAELTNLERPGGTDPWTVSTLAADDVLRMPEIGVEVPVSEFYLDLQPA